MKYIAFFTALCLSNVPATAQDLVYHADPTIDCLADATDPAMRHACIGAAANLCMVDNPGGFSTPGMGGCLDYERAWWDARLNDVYGQLLVQHAERPAVLDKMRAMQRTWIRYRDARCDFEFVQWEGGTGQGPALLACLMTATAAQTLVLEDQLR